MSAVFDVTCAASACCTMKVREVKLKKINTLLFWRLNLKVGRCFSQQTTLYNECVALPQLLS